MSQRVQLYETNKGVVVEPHETILEAFIRSGLNVNYGCSNGNCGLCVTHLISGNIKQLKHSDYVMRMADKANNGFLACVNTAASPCVVEANLIDGNQAIVPQHFRVRIRDIKQYDGRVCVLTVQSARNHRLRFFAGQYAHLSTHEDARARDACQGKFSIASCPCDGHFMEFHIPLNGQSFSRYLVEQDRVRQHLYLKAPYGTFYFSENLSHAVVLFAVGVGFAPIKSLIEHISAQESEVPLCLYWLASPGEHYMHNLCRSWQDALDQMKIHLIDLPIASTGVDLNEEAKTCEAISEHFMHMLKTESKLHNTAVDIYCGMPPFAIPAVQAVVKQAQVPSNWNFLYEPIHSY